MRTTLRSLTLSLLAAAALVAVPSAQTPQQPKKVFRLSTQIVSVDIIVRDDKGAVVKGLKAEDFEVSEDGTMRRTSANRSPGVTRVFGRPRPFSRSRFPLDVPGLTRTLASPPGVSTATDAPRAASHGASGRST